MRGEGKGRRALGSALLLLAVTIAAPALSSAQEGAQAPATPAAPADPVQQPAPPAPGPAPAAAPAAAPQGTGEAAAAPERDPAAAQPVADRSSAKPQTAKASASATVSTGDNFYSPTSVSVSVGDTVTWNNTGAAQHSATAEDKSFDTGIFGPGQSRSQTFDSPGTFKYYCLVHGLSQSGTVTVRAASDTGGGGGGGAGASSGGGSSEAAAVASPDAAGTSTSLPSTGFPALLLGLIGVGLLWSGVAAGRAADRLEGRRRSGIRFHSIY